MSLKTLLVLALILSSVQLPIFVKPFALGKKDLAEVPVDYATIQEAINNAAEGDTIFVYNGVHSGNVVVNKTVSLLGESIEETIMDGNGSGVTVSILAENVNVSGFTIRGSGGEAYNSGVFLESAFCNISGNIIAENGLFGICTNHSSNNVISQNTVWNNKVDGIVLYDSSANTIDYNTIAENKFGVHLYRSDSNIISDNIFTNNSLGGINLLASSENSLVNNDLLGNSGIGIILDYSADYNTLAGNNITATQGFGLTVGSCSNNILRNNSMTSNTYNFYCPASRPNLQDFSNDIDTSNTIDGLPIWYMNSMQGLLIDPSTFPSIGYLALVNCTDIIVQDISLSANGQGLFLAFSTNILVKHIDASRNNHGLQLLSSFNNTIIDSVLSNNTEDGITLDYSTTTTTVKHNTLTNNKNAIRMAHDTNENIIEGNLMTDNTKGMWIYSFNVENSIANNVLTENSLAISMERGCENNSIVGNTISNNGEGIFLSYCQNNTLYYNDFLNNTVHAQSMESTNMWDNGYPIGGNYWSNYTGADIDHDGIGDSVHTLDASNTDRHPLAGIFTDFETTVDDGEIRHIQVISNSTVDGFAVLQWLSSPTQHLQPGQRYIRFNATGYETTEGFCRIIIPREVLNGTYVVLVDGQETMVSELMISNVTHAQLYFSYQHSTREVVIVPELKSIFFAFLFLVGTMLVVSVRTGLARVQSEVPWKIRRRNH